MEIIDISSSDTEVPLGKRTLCSEIIEVSDESEDEIVPVKKRRLIEENVAGPSGSSAHGHRGLPSGQISTKGLRQRM